MAKKRDLRQLFRIKRSRLSSQELSDASIQVFNRIKSCKLVEGNLIMLYFSSEKQLEIPTDLLFSLSINYKLCVPKIINKNGAMEAIKWNKDMPVITNGWGIKEPLSNDYILPKKIDVIVVPLLLSLIHI